MDSKSLKEIYDLTDKGEKKIWKKYCKEFLDKPLASILPKVRRIIVIGDIHGDWEEMLNTLRIAGVIKKDPEKWTGEDTVVVQVGDQIDRTRQPNNPEETPDDEASDVKILEYFTRLHNKAIKEGGAVYSLLGNHELMNVMGDMKYVSPANIRDFDNYVKPDGSIIEDGMEAREWAFSPGNPMAKFLACTRIGILVIGSNLFVHAGIVPDLAKEYKIKEVNRLVRLWLLGKLKDDTEFKKILQSADYSPFWNRIMGQIPIGKRKDEDYCKSVVNKVLKLWKVGRIFVGHTPTYFQHGTGINSTCNKTLYRTDVGMSKAFRNHDKKYGITGKESELRDAAVVEILKDGKEINILK